MNPTRIDEQDRSQRGLTSRPFEDLAKRLASSSRNNNPPKGRPPDPKGGQEASCQIDPDMELFLKAMDGVKPLKNRKNKERIPQRNRVYTRQDPQDKDMKEAIRELKELVQGKRPLPVEKIPEYIDGPQINSDRRLLRRLRAGGFAIQAYCELHGLTEEQALKVCDGFMADSLMSNRRCIAYIHGRGKSSPGKPVLKEMVKNFLNRGRFRRYILAYCSAPSWDGGPGVTYVLLRKRPVKKAKRR